MNLIKKYPNKRTVDLRISGIPCKALIFLCKRVPAWKGSAESCPSDLDWSGYTELEFAILDRRGYEAEWLEKKIPADSLEELVIEAYQSQYGEL